MKIKCRGYTGDLIYLDAKEYFTSSRNDDEKYAKIELDAVNENEIEIINEDE